VLHTHPWNERRVTAGKPPVNSLWFWGGGVLPDQVAAPMARVHGGDALLRALALRAGLRQGPRGSGFEPPEEDVLVDLRDARDADVLHARWLAPAADAVQGGTLRELRLD